MFKAANNKYLIKPVEVKKETAGGIILSSTNETQLAEIVDVGTGMDKPIPVGAIIALNWGQTAPITHKNEVIFVVEPQSIYAVLND